MSCQCANRRIRPPVRSRSCRSGRRSHPSRCCPRGGPDDEGVAVQRYATPELIARIQVKEHSRRISMGLESGERSAGSIGQMRGAGAWPRRCAWSAWVTKSRMLATLARAEVEGRRVFEETGLDTHGCPTRELRREVGDQWEVSVYARVSELEDLAPDLRIHSRRCGVGPP